MSKLGIYLLVKFYLENKYFYGISIKNSSLEELLNFPWELYLQMKIIPILITA